MLTIASTAQRSIRLGSHRPAAHDVGALLDRVRLTTRRLGDRTIRGEPAIARETSRRNLVFGWPRVGAGP